MLKYEGWSIVLQEVPDEISLVLNITGCPYHCAGCHSEYLQYDTGDPVWRDLDALIQMNLPYISCVCFMGGDHELTELVSTAKIIKSKYPELLTCIYTGNDNPDPTLFDWFDYVKYGHYDKDLGGLNSPTTNQRMIKHGTDITYKFQRKHNED